MLCVISPAKSLELEKPYPNCKTDTPRLLEFSKELVALLKKLKSKDLEKLMDISEKLAQLNKERFDHFHTPFDPSNARPALFTFDGDVYTGLDAFGMNKKSLTHCSKHLRILSGLYGLLRPLDLIQPYRLEMGTALKNKKGKNLYAFWSDEITRLLEEDIHNTGSKFLINLASQEYFQAIDPKKISVPVLQCSFKERSGNSYKIISFTAKKARGLMARFIIDHGLKKPEDLKAFQTEGYLYSESLSTAHDYVFTRG